VVWSDSKIDEVWSEKLREKIKGRNGGRKKKEKNGAWPGKGSVSILKRKGVVTFNVGFTHAKGTKFVASFKKNLCEWQTQTQKNKKKIRVGVAYAQVHIQVNVK